MEEESLQCIKVAFAGSVHEEENVLWPRNTYNGNEDKSPRKLLEKICKEDTD